MAFLQEDSSFTVMFLTILLFTLFYQLEAASFLYEKFATDSTIKTNHIEQVEVTSRNKCFQKCSNNDECHFIGHVFLDTTKTRLMCTLYPNTPEPENNMMAQDGVKLYKRVFPRDCLDLYDIYGMRKSGVYEIYVEKIQKIEVYCEMEIAGGGWTVFQKRFDGSISFHDKTWVQFKNGFGNKDGEHWLSNDILHKMTAFENQELIVRGVDFDGNIQECKHDSFTIDNESNKYRIEYTPAKITKGTAVKGCVFHPAAKNSAYGHKFSTADQDNDSSETLDCANRFQTAWWLATCFTSNLNGPFPQQKDTVSRSIGIVWNDPDTNMKSTVMMMRRSNF